MKLWKIFQLNFFKKNKVTIRRYGIFLSLTILIIVAFQNFGPYDDYARWRSGVFAGYPRPITRHVEITDDQFLYDIYHIVFDPNGNPDSAFMGNMASLKTMSRQDVFNFFIHYPSSPFQKNGQLKPINKNLFVKRVVKALLKQTIQDSDVGLSASTLSDTSDDSAWYSYYKWIASSEFYKKANCSQNSYYQYRGSSLKLSSSTHSPTMKDFYAGNAEFRGPYETYPDKNGNLNVEDVSLPDYTNYADNGKARNIDYGYYLTPTTPSTPTNPRYITPAGWSPAVGDSPKNLTGLESYSYGPSLILFQAPEDINPDGSSRSKTYYAISRRQVSYSANKITLVLLRSDDDGITFKPVGGKYGDIFDIFSVAAGAIPTSNPVVSAENLTPANSWVLPVFYDPHLSVDASSCPTKYVLTYECGLPGVNMIPSLCQSVSVHPTDPLSWSAPKILVNGCGPNLNSPPYLPNPCVNPNYISASVGMSLFDDIDDQHGGRIGHEFLAWNASDVGASNVFNTPTNRLSTMGRDAAIPVGTYNDVANLTNISKPNSISSDNNILLDATPDIHCGQPGHIAGDWDCNIKGVVDWIKEGDDYFMLYNGANFSQIWRDPTDVDSKGKEYTNIWSMGLGHSTTGPLGRYDGADRVKFLTSTLKYAAGVQYGSINVINGEIYLYYGFNPVEKSSISVIKRTKLVWK
jgi:hypothetical protein